MPRKGRRSSAANPRKRFKAHMRATGGKAPRPFNRVEVAELRKLGLITPQPLGVPMMRLRYPNNIPVVWDPTFAFQRLRQFWRKLQHPQWGVKLDGLGYGENDLDRYQDAPLLACRAVGPRNSTGQIQTRCPTCGAWTRYHTPLIAVGQQWTCRECHPDWPTLYWLQIARVMFALRIGLMNRKFNRFKRKVAATMVQRSLIASTPEDAAYLAAGASLLSLDPKRALRVKVWVCGPRSGDHTVFWHALRPYMLHAYLDSFLHPTAYLADWLSQQGGG